MRRLMRRVHSSTCLVAQTATRQKSGGCSSLRVCLKFSPHTNATIGIGTKLAPPYGSRGGVNNDPEAPAAVVDFRTNAGERVRLPARNAEIFTGVSAMVVFASESELAALYYRQDNVALGYMVHMANFCVDPNLVAAYRAQLNGGKRSTNQLPAVRNGQAVGTSTGIITVAIRDRARFYDPRSRKDWWQGAPQP